MRTLTMMLALAMVLGACGGDEPECTQVPLGAYDVTYTKTSAGCEGWNDSLTVPLTLADGDEFAMCGAHEQTVKESIGLDCSISTKESVTSTDEGFSGTAKSTLTCGPLGQSLGGMPERCEATYDLVAVPRSTASQ